MSKTLFYTALTACSGLLLFRAIAWLALKAAFYFDNEVGTLLYLIAMIMTPLTYGAVVVQLVALAGAIAYTPVLALHFELASAIRIATILLCLVPPILAAEMHTKQFFLSPVWLMGAISLVTLYLLYRIFERFLYLSTPRDN